MAAPDSVLRLVDKFHTHRDAYVSPGYNETQVRREFIDPLFTALGWDVDNRQGYAEQYKDVIHEDAIKIGGATKAPDYCFRIGGVRKFFLEAKKPAVNLKENTEPAYQLRRYAWTAKLPLSVLSDFEEFIVYDTRVKPAERDPAATARTFYIPYTDYAERWDEIAGVFSREAILRGAFDKYVQSATKKRGTAEVDDAFLAEIQTWREALAKNIALRNPSLSQRELNFAVQRTIDRIVFLRICEDRGIEEYARLLAQTNGPGVYPRLCHLFHQADDRYNSGLFHFHTERDRPGAPDALTLAISIDDKVLRDIIRRLYYPECPYEFSVFPVEILGQVYERFLGSVIRLTPGHQAKVEEKPEVRKAGGIYYTPSYIVDYIVKHTVGKLLEDKKPGPQGGASKLRILDPACGSGSFLLGAYKFLLDWHLEQYLEDKDRWAKAKNPTIYQHHKLGWRLTTAERKRILTNNLYGVDIDPQAVEVTKLSLLLKVLEDENAESIQRQLQLFHERALPDLANNIKCGNSLIGPDFYKDKQLDAFDEEEMYRINAFDWNAEFKEIMVGGGFDAVIGNPPYIRVRAFKEIEPKQAEYLERNYKCATHVWDIYLLFFEIATRLMKEGGRISFIVPIQTLHQPNCESVRQLLTSQCKISAVVDLSRLRVFQQAIVKNAILVCEKGLSDTHLIQVFEPSIPNDLQDDPKRLWPQEDVLQNPGFSLKTDLLSTKRGLCDKLRENSCELQELFYVTFGLRSCAKGRGQGGKDRLITSDSNAANAVPYLEGRDIQRYCIKPTLKYLRYLPDEMYSPRKPGLFETKKILSQSMLSRMRLTACLDDQGYYVEQSLVCIIPHGIITPPKCNQIYSLEFVLGIMNSLLQSFYFSTFLVDYSLGGGLVHATPGSQGHLLIPQVSMEQADCITKPVRRMLALHQGMVNSRSDHERSVIKRQIDATDAEIDRIVYELYALDAAEIHIIEDYMQ